MRKLLLIISLAFLSLATSAQFRYGALVGYTNSTLKFNQKLIDVSSASGFRAGVMGEMMFPGIGFGLDIGALYNMEGAKLHLGQKEVWASEGYTTPRVFLHYLEIPINLKFKWTRMQGLEDYFAPYVFVGPTIQFLLGHSRIPALGYYKCAAGLQVGLGCEIFRKWQVQGLYNWGVSSSVNTKKLDDFTSRNRSWSISVLRFF